MAESSHPHPPGHIPGQISPMVHHEPTTSYLDQAPSSDLSSELNPSTSETTINATHTHTVDLEQPEQSVLRTETTASNASTSKWGLRQRPTRQGAATEAPSKLTRSHTVNPNDLGLKRTATLTFYPEAAESDGSSSDSESSDDEIDPKKDGLGRIASAKPELPNQASQESEKGYSRRFKLHNDYFKTRGKISKCDGRLKLSIQEKDFGSGYIAKAFGTAFRKDPKDNEETLQEDGRAEVEKIAPENDEMENDLSRRIKLNIVIIVIGSRGDIQPFIRIAQILQNDYGHRVRVATHPTFRDLITEEAGLEFFSIGGNPQELMAFMVKNPGILPGFDSIKEGEIGRRRAQMYEMFTGMYRACTCATEDQNDLANTAMTNDAVPFVADSIIANPPSFAPAHIAEKLGIPLHMTFTFPYSPTSAYPHPLANIKSSNVEPKYTNFMSYPLVDIMVWQGLGDLINKLRTEVLHLEEVSTLWAPGQLYRLRIPFNYMWSPALVPKPKDWGPEIDITGFVFLDMASKFKPPDELQAFLNAGDPPVYIGFGSIVVDDPDRFTQLIFDAVKLVGCRALISKGWGGFGSNADVPDNIFMLENTPHDWLFPRCSAVVHHGGAGTTAAGLKFGKPTMIVPFFGDQPFWGAMVSKAKAGAHECIPYKKINVENLAAGIRQCLSEDAKLNVQKIADSISAEGDGALNAVRSFHRSLPFKGPTGMRCDLLSNRTATWRVKKANIKLSPLAAEILVEKKWIKRSELRLLRHKEWNDFGGAGEPLTGAWGSLVTSFTDAAVGVGSVPVDMTRSIRKREKYYEQQRKKAKRAKAKQRALSNGGEDSGIPAHIQVESRLERPTATRVETNLSVVSEPHGNLVEELGGEVIHGAQKTGGAITHLPVNLLLAITQGFHNAPRLYGDATVRPPPRVTGLQSGLRAGRDELIYGVRDGFTGTITQPYRGAKEDGFTGMVRGVGHGLGGLVLKNIAAVLGPTAYTLKGLDAEYMKKYQGTEYFRAARERQGQLELKSLRRLSEVVDEHGDRISGPPAQFRETREGVERRVLKGWVELKQCHDANKIKDKTNSFMSSWRMRGQKSQLHDCNLARKSTEENSERSAEPPVENKRSPAESQPSEMNGVKRSEEGAESYGNNAYGGEMAESKAKAGAGMGLNRSATAPTMVTSRG